MLQHIPLFLPITLCFIRSHIPLSPFYHPSDSSPRLAPLVLFKEIYDSCDPGHYVANFPSKGAEATDRNVGISSLHTLFYVLIF